MTISPSGVVSVCNGDHLEFTCTITNPGHGSFGILLWNVTLITVTDDAPTSYTRAISLSSPSDQIARIVANTTSLSFSRISAQNSFPFISRLLISPVSRSVNGTEVNCLDAYTLESSSVVVINITSGHPIHGTYDSI